MILTLFQNSFRVQSGRLCRLSIMALVIISLFSSCKVLPVEIGEVKNVQLLGISGTRINMRASVPLTNPNNFRFTIKSLDIYVVSRRDTMGKITKLEKIVVPANSELLHDLHIEFAFPDLLSGGLSLLKLYARQEIELTLTGLIKARAFGVSKNVVVNEAFILNLRNQSGSRSSPPG